jgi:hypothetical protein
MIFIHGGIYKFCEVGGASSALGKAALILWVKVPL